MEREDADKFIIRFSLNQRIQHWVLLISMLVLLLTGLALMFSNTWFGRFMIMIEGGIQTRGLIHRIAAIVLVGLSVYHIFYVMFTEEGHRELMALRPRLRDFRDFFQNLKYNFGMDDEPPKFYKYDFRQKFQYFGVWVGGIIMVVTGFILWFETQSLAIYPKWVIDIIAIIHGWEGVIIFFILLLLHLYNVHLNPDVFPMSRTWLTGKLSVDEMRNRHQLEYEKMSNAEEDKR
ncbi:MAG: cytochrome b/b6 domain-containing protein [Fidelibacterota bacterium]